MSLGRIISGAVRSLVLAAAAGVAALGFLAVLHPFATTPAAVQTALVHDTRTDDLRARIDAARSALAATEAALDNVKGVSSEPDAIRAQYEAQIAAATERRDLSMRHAQAIRDALQAHAPVTSLAAIRDSAVIGQLIARQSALEATIAEQGARLKASHPTMRALLAQRAALAAQIDAEAVAVASALEAEARLDDAQIALLQSQLTPVTTNAAPDSTSDVTVLSAKAAAQRAELDRLMDQYFALSPSAAPTATFDLLNPLNLAVVAVAALATLAFSALLATRRARTRRLEANLAAWREDRDHETFTAAPAGEAEPALRRAS